MNPSSKAVCILLSSQPFPMIEERVPPGPCFPLAALFLGLCLHGLLWRFSPLSGNIEGFGVETSQKSGSKKSV